MVQGRVGIDTEAVRAQLRLVYRGRPVIVIGPSVVGGAATVRHLLALGATRVLVVSLPDVVAATTLAGARGHGVNLEGEHSIITQRRWDAMLADPPPDLVGVVEDFDPERVALVLIAPWCLSDRVLDRPAYGPRRPAWEAWEDKLAVQTLWDVAGVPTAPAVVVDVADAPVAAAELDRGQGTVWAGDAREGRHGGMFGVRWVPGHADAEATAAAMAHHYRQVRVMRFLPGLPCGIHGLALEDGVVVLRPVEHVVVRAAKQPRLRAVGAGTVWDPPGWAYEEIRAIARRVGTALGELVGYRSSFSIDGVLTADGFRPSECNPRWGAAIGYLDDALPELPYLLLHHAIAAGADLRLAPGDLEELLLAAADARRRASVFSVLDRWPGQPGTQTLLRTHDGWRPAPAGVQPEATLTANREAGGWFVRMTYDAARLPTGLPLADEAISALAWLDRTFDTGIGELSPGLAPTVRLREASAEDAIPVGALRTAAWRAAYRGIVADAVLDGMSDTAPGWLAGAFPARPGQLSVVAESDTGRLLGFVTARPRRDHEQGGEIGQLYVAPHAWRQGVGAALLAAAEDRLTALGHRQAVVWTLTANHPARRFYYRAGWTPDGERSTWRVGSDDLPEIRYGRRLPATGEHPRPQRVTDHYRQ